MSSRASSRTKYFSNAFIAVARRSAARPVLPTAPLPRCPSSPLPRGPAAPLVTPREEWEFDPALARDDLARRFNLASLDGLGIGPQDELALGAAGALLRYLTDLQPAGLPHLARPGVRRPESFLWLDEMTRRNLELVEPLRAGVRG
ncbi:MAG TPA: hypothetical protein VK899_06625 [Gemmatimonadales bacterium]|nr:hypothetical protein [Gemmatimonadales bacterium]